MSETLDQIQAALDATGVWVDPALGPRMDADHAAELAALVAQAPTPIYVVAHNLDPTDDFGGSPDELLTQLHDASGNPGLYLSATIFGPDNFLLTSREWGPAPETWKAFGVARERHPDSMGDAYVDATDLLVSGTSDQVWAEVVEPTLGRESSTSTGSPNNPGPGEDGGGFAVGAGLGLVVAAVVAVIAWRQVRQRGPRSRTYSLPASVVANVRDAHDRQLTRRAEDEVLALGEAIDRAELSAADDAASWQQALDHYEAAQRVLRGTGAPDILDVVGAVVLAARGEQALLAAKAGRAFRPGKPCYLNPLHEAPRSQGTVESNGRRVDVPLCNACRTDLQKGRTPDVLDVLRDNRPVHYFESGTEPWASTGYGAVQSDLVQRLHQGP